jgi:hypothetical protein
MSWELSMSSPYFIRMIARDYFSNSYCNVLAHLPVRFVRPYLYTTALPRNHFLSGFIHVKILITYSSLLPNPLDFRLSHTYRGRSGHFASRNLTWWLSPSPGQRPRALPPPTKPFYIRLHLPA